MLQGDSTKSPSRLQWLPQEIDYYMGENAFLIQSPDQDFKMCQVLAAVDFLYFNVFSYLLVKQHWLIITLHSYASRPPHHLSSTWLPRALLPRRCRSVPTRGSVRATFLLRNRRGSASRFRTWHSNLKIIKNTFLHLLSTPKASYHPHQCTHPVTLPFKQQDF